MLHPALLIAAAANSLSKPARNCCTAMNPFKAIVLPNPHTVLVQIAVSTPLRTRSMESAEALSTEHCRYGTGDFATTETAAAKTLGAT
jgi:hypothetical protein